MTAPAVREAEPEQGPAALLTDPTGRPIDPGELAVGTAALDPARLPAVQALADRGGRSLVRDGCSLYSWGVAARLALPSGLTPGAAAEAEALLAALPASRVGPGAPLALGSLPFDPAEAGSLVVPEVAVLARGGDEPLAVAVGAAGALEALLGGFPFVGPPPPALPLERPPDRFELVAVHTHDEFEELVGRALAAIEAGTVEKVVVAREVSVSANRDFQQAHLLERLRALYPACAVFGLDGFVGASPELLVRRRGLAVLSQPLAGTIPRSGDPDEDARLAAGMLRSPKERHEHALVVGAIAEGLAATGAAVDPPGDPHLLTLRNVSHLATTLHARLPEPAVGRPPGALSLVAAIHPTPAIGGVPTAAALEFLARHERLERGRYAGPVGYLDAGGDGEFWLGIRSAMLAGPTARLVAGVGIVAGSDPHAELVETQLKLQALLAAAVRP